MGSIISNGEVPPPREILVQARPERTRDSVFVDRYFTVVVFPKFENGEISFSIDPPEEDLKDVIFKNMDETKVLAPWEISVTHIKNPFHINPTVELHDFLCKGKPSCRNFSQDAGALEDFEESSLASFVLMAKTNGETEIPLFKSHYELKKLKTYAGLTETKLSDMVTIPQNTKEGQYYTMKQSLFYLFICENANSLMKHVRGENFVPDDNITPVKYLHDAYIKVYQPDREDRKRVKKSANHNDKKKVKGEIEEEEEEDSTEKMAKDLDSHKGSKNIKSTTFTKHPITNRDKEMLQINPALASAAYTAIKNIVNDITYINRNTYKVGFSFKPTEKAAFEAQLTDTNIEDASKAISITFRLKYVQTEMPDDTLPFHNSPLNPKK